MAGVTDHDVFPEEVRDIPSVGGYFDPSLEKILSLSPDLVIGISTFHGRLLERLESLGVRTLPLTIHRGLEGVGDSLSVIGEMIGKSDKADDLWSEIQNNIDLVARDVEISFPGGAPSMLVVVWHDPLTVAGGVNFIDDILSRIGIPNAAGDINYTFPQMDPEGVIVRDPDIILVPQTEKGMSLSPDVLTKALKGLSIRAVEEGRIVPVSADLLFHPGPRVADAARLLLGSIMQFRGSLR